jgi:hypothetical protein
MFPERKFSLSFTNLHIFLFTKSISFQQSIKFSGMNIYIYGATNKLNAS